MVVCVIFSVVCRCYGHTFGDASCFCGLVASCTHMLRGRSPFLLHHLFISRSESMMGMWVLCCSCMWLCLVQYQ